MTVSTCVKWSDQWGSGLLALSSKDQYVTHHPSSPITHHPHHHPSPVTCIHHHHPPLPTTCYHPHHHHQHRTITSITISFASPLPVASKKAMLNLAIDQIWRTWTLSGQRNTMCSLRISFSYPPPRSNPPKTR